MSQETVKYNRSFAGSIGAGMKSVFAGKGRRYYELVHKTRSKYHQEGAVQKIIIDNIELGRDPKCQVRFDDSFTTVSRRHAAIVKEGDGWKLVQLSKTNSTYLNGNKVSDSWYLQSGDEIQLSTGGPKMGFVVPQGDAGLVKSIGLTNRLTLFRKQALRPYKTALWCLLGVLIAACAVGGWLLYKQGQKNAELKETITLFEKQSKEAEEAMKAKMDSLSKVNVDMEKQIKGLRSKIKSSSSSQSAAKPNQNSSTVTTPAPKNFTSIEQCFPFIYYIISTGFVITDPDGNQGELICGETYEDIRIPFYTATGFLLNDGRFVTARHVAEPWQFWQDADGVDPLMQQFNYIENNGGKVDCFFKCFSPTGDIIQCKSSDYRVNRSQDQVGTYESGYKFSLGGHDFAYMQTGRSDGLAYDDVICDHLKVKTELSILGYPQGLGANGINDTTPIFSNAIVGVEGLQRGMILTTDRNTDHGNSGGPVFYTDDSGNLKVVGLVSGGLGEMVGFIVPMSKVR